MALYERLLGLGAIGTKIPVHSFMAALGEIERGRVTESAMASAFGLDTGEQTELATLVAKIKTPNESYSLFGRVPLTNVGTTYDANDDSLSLPFLYIERAGITQINIELRVRKVGTGTQEWALWNDTNSVNIITTESGSATANTTGSLSDAGVAGDRTLQASRTFPTSLSAGLAKLRLRCKSTVGTDDPVLLGGALLIFRVDRLTAVELHEVLLLGEMGVAYTTANSLKSRLGVS